MTEKPISNPVKSKRKTGETEPGEPNKGVEPIEKQPEYTEEKAPTENSDQIKEPTLVEKSSEGRLMGDAQIGEVIEKCPEAEDVLEKYFGACAKCPAIVTETINFQVSIHRVDLESVLNELDKLCQ